MQGHGLEINWTKTKIQVFNEDISQPSKVSVLDHDVEVVDSFVYLGSCIDIAGGIETDICRRIEMTRTCTKALDRKIVTFGVPPLVYRPRSDFTMCTYSRYSSMVQTRGV